jgi:hypothetical protein
MRFYLFAALIPLLTVTAIPAEPGLSSLEFRREIEERKAQDKEVKVKIHFDTWDPYNNKGCSATVIKSCTKKGQVCSKRTPPQP